MVVWAAFLTGCQEKIRDLETKREQVTDKTDDWEINVDYAVFSSVNPETDKNCEVLNTEIRTLVTGLQDSLKAAATGLFQGLEADSIDRPSWRYSLFVTDSVFMATDEYASVRLTVYTFTGGAHGMTDFYTFNYDLKNQKMLASGDIVDHSHPEVIDQLLKSHFSNPENCFTTDPTLGEVAVINFTPMAICFTYAPYILGPYACGAAEVTVPRSELKGKI